MRNSNMHELANKLNQMKNPIHIGPSIAKVVKLEPFTVSIADGLILLTEGEELIVSDQLKNKKYKCKIKADDVTISGMQGEDSITITDISINQDAEITIKPEIKVNDLILVVPLEGEQYWVAVGGRL